MSFCIPIRMTLKKSLETRLLIIRTKSWSRLRTTCVGDWPKHEMITKIAAHQLKLDRDEKNRLDAQAAEARTSSNSTARYRLEELDAKTAALSGLHQEHREANQKITAIVSSKAPTYRSSAKKAPVFAEILKEFEDNNRNLRKERRRHLQQHRIRKDEKNGKK